MQILVNILLVINVFVCVALIAVVLIQRSEGGALGMGGGGGPSGFLTTRGAGDLLTRMTWILASAFFVLSMTETLLSARTHGVTGSLVDHINVNSLDLAGPATKPGAAPAPIPATGAPVAASSAPPVIQAPTPTAQSPAPPAPAADPLAVLNGQPAPAQKKK